MLFDLDGTLVDSAPGILSSLAAAFRECRCEPVMTLDQSIIGPPLAKTLQRLAGTDDAVTIAALSDAFRRDYDSRGYQATIPYAGVEHSIEALRDRSVRIFVVTNKRHRPTGLIVDLLGWRRLFHGVYSLDSIDPPSCDKAALVRTVLRLHGIESAGTILVGDSPDDEVAARSNGLRFLAAGWGYASDAMRDGRYGQVLAAPAELLECTRPMPTR
jgi:phosphoglycolate phosphatase